MYTLLPEISVLWEQGARGVIGPPEMSAAFVGDLLSKARTSARTENGGGSLSTVRPKLSFASSSWLSVTASLAASISASASSFSHSHSESETSSES